MPRFKHWMVALIVLVGVLSPTLTAQAVVSSVAEFDDTWARTDLPVADGDASRTWMWGPAPFTEPLVEDYIGVPENFRAVQYFDKSRMEINDPNGDPSSPWYVTNGLLVVEMTDGEIHVGFEENERVQRSPAEVNVAGDSDDPTGPTYATIGNLIDDPIMAYNQGDVIFEVIDRSGWDLFGSLEMEDVLSAYGVTAAEYSPNTGKYTASVFWEFMNSNALVYQNGDLVNAPLFQDPYYATGLPIDNAWWAEVKVGGTYKWVLLQCFERRCLTYTPDNPAGWQVEAGNVGLHYYEWRYGGAPVDPPPPTAPPMSEDEYTETILDIDAEFLDSVENLRILFEEYDPSDAAWVEYATTELALWRELAAEIDTLNPPPSLAGVHQMIVDAYVYFVDASHFLENGIIENDPDQIEAGQDLFDIGWEMLADAFDILLGSLSLTDEEYLDYVSLIDETFLESVDQFFALEEIYDPDDPALIPAVIAEVQFWRMLADLMSYVVPPDSYTGIHASLLEAYDLIELASWNIENGINQQDGDLIVEGVAYLNTALGMLDDIFATPPSEW